MWFDFVVVAVLLYATLRGAAKGIVWQLAVIGSILACFAFSESISVAIAPFFAVKPPLDRWLAMLVLYVVFSFLSFAAARQLKGWIDKAHFHEYDRHLGAVFGFLKGVLFSLVVTFFIVTLGEQAPSVREAVFHSYSGKAAAVIMDRLHPVMPKELHAVLEPYIHSLDRPNLGLQYGHHDYDHDGGHHDHHHGPVDGHAHDPAPFEPDAGPRVPEPLDLRQDPFGEADDPVRPGATDRIREPGPIQPVGGVGEQFRKLLGEMGAAYSDDPTARRAITKEIEESLTGIPDAVRLGIIEDWHADLMSFDPATDPDPETTLSTPLDERIVRQMRRAGVSLSTLNAKLRDRLRDVRLR